MFGEWQRTLPRREYPVQKDNAGTQVELLHRHAPETIVYGTSHTLEAVATNGAHKQSHLRSGRSIAKVENIGGVIIWFNLAKV
jgi:hypothetical protein